MGKRWTRLREASAFDKAGIDPRERHTFNGGQVQRLVDSLNRVQYARSGPSVLRASGAKITRMPADQLRAVAGNKQPWQPLAWRYRDMVPELRYGLQYRSRAISRVRFYAAEVIGDDDEPIALSIRNDEDPEKAARITLPEDLCQAAEDELARLPLDAGLRFLGTWSENFDVAGDCWLHGFTDPQTQEETWKIRSILDVDIAGNSITIKDPLGRPRKVNLDREELYRLWVPHPAHDHLADSALNALQDVLEEIVLTGREIRAVSRSRIMQNGVIFIPDSMADQRNVREDADTPLERRRAFMADFEASMLAPIANEGDAGGVVPMMMTGTPEEIAAIRYERFEREPSPLLLEKLAKALGRMANSLDIPPEILTGMADVNHWTAWQIDNATFRHHLEPSIRLMVDSLTGAFLRAALLKSGFPAEQVKRVRIWYDAGQITENPNRRQDALDALDRILIGPKAGREALGFNDADAPTPEEALALIAAKNGIDQSTAAAILAWAAEQEGATDLPDNLVKPAVAAQPPQRQLPPGQAPSNAGAPGGSGSPDTAPDGIAASAARVTWTVLSDQRSGTCQCGADLNGGECSVAERYHNSSMELGHTPEERAMARQRIHAQAMANFVAPLPNRMGVDPQALADAVHGLAASGVPDGYRVDWSAARDLADIDTALREQILQAADKAAKEALQRAANRLRAKTTSPKLDDGLRAELRQLPVGAWAAHMGADQCLALNADQKFLLAGAWGELSGKFGKWVRTGIDKTVKRVLRMLGLQDGSLDAQATARAIRTDMESRIDTAWAHLQDGLDEYLERALFEPGTDAQFDPDGSRRGEVPEFDIPAGLVRDALSEIGGTPGTLADGPPSLGGLTDGTAVTGALGDRGAVHVGMEWRYGYMPRNTFPPHENLDGQRFLSWTDEALATTPEYAWIGPYFHVGDHGGCQCSWFTVYALPTGGTPEMVFAPQDVPVEQLQALQREFLEGAP